ncbi:MAG: YggT family protein [Candidatus Omnitrophica bacterium]|nr:YggT family protein [Candidatus Omnitrophota bacterium]MBU0881412.1 YggT family protein [Candidatus Omnitrophota bacterium]MBU1809176.1 YggT family protein [Candidatus Omnitrophota bacterium]
MFILGNLIAALATIIDYLLTIISWMIIIRALLSWVNPDPYNGVVRFLYGATEPMLAPFKRILPAYSIGIDFSPIFALLTVWFIKLFLVRTLFGIAMRLGR